MYLSYLRSHLQVSVYRLCELTFDTATGHAFYVSGDTFFLQHYTHLYGKWCLFNWKLLCFICALPSSSHRFCLKDNSSGFVCSYINMFKCLCSFRENLLADCLQGCFVVTCTLCAFISLVWLREQIVHGGAPQWLEQHQPPPPNAAGQANEVLCLTNDQWDQFIYFYLTKGGKQPIYLVNIFLTWDTYSSVISWY